MFDMCDGDTISSNLPYGKAEKTRNLQRALATSPHYTVDEPAAGMNPWKLFNS